MADAPDTPAVPTWKALPRERKARIRFRLAGLMAAGILLLTVCQQGSTLFTVAIAFTVYVVAATLWVRGQYQAWVEAIRDGDLGKLPWAFRRRTSVVFLKVGVLLALLGLWLGESFLLLLGVLAAYLFSGYLLTSYRMYTSDEERRRSERRGKRLLFGVGVAVPAGLLLLAVTEWAGILVATVLLAPIGMSLRAEPKVRDLLAGPTQRATRLALTGGGLALADIGLALLRLDTLWIAAALVALMLLVAAIVSSTQADIAIVIGAVALMGVTSGSEPKPDALAPTPGQRVLVALGDSYMSGEGAQTFYSEGELDGANHCHRAPTAWAAMAGQRKFEAVAFLACSGARTFNVRHGGTPQYNEPATQLDQVDALKRTLGEDFDPELVVVGLGGNDAGFSMIGMSCLAPGDCSERGGEWEGRLPSVGKALSDTFAEIDDEFEQSPVVVTAYPAPIATDRYNRPLRCDRVALSRNDMRFVDSFVTDLNATVHKAAAKNHFYFLGEMQNALVNAHLQLCDARNPNRPGLNFIGLRSVGGIAAQRFNPSNWYHNSLHPNERGHAAMAQVFEEWLDKHKEIDDDAPGGGEIDDDADPPKPPCDLYGGDSQRGKVPCTGGVTKWIGGQVAAMLLWRDWWGVQFALAALGAWLLAVGLFGRRRPWWPKPPE